MDNKYDDIGKAINQFIDRVRSDINTNTFGKKTEEKRTMNNKDLNNKPKTTEVKKVELSSPWQTYFNKLKALFGQDPEVHLGFHDGNFDKQIIIRVDKLEKYDAINKLLPETVAFGNVIVNIIVVPANNENHVIDRSELLDRAFNGNPIYDKLITVKGDVPILGGTKYVMFKKKVAQFFNDNMADPNGNSSYLYADLAEDMFGHVEGEALHYSTSEEE